MSLRMLVSQFTLFMGLVEMTEEAKFETAARRCSEKFVRYCIVDSLCSFHKGTGPLRMKKKETWNIVRSEGTLTEFAAYNLFPLCSPLDDIDQVIKVESVGSRGGMDGNQTF
ncbi:hypothetical protein WN55_10413 [Dufourea novaeangliae]|uniref:Uncharacterized protein n=1 Tax=Dufourea novaeangliae TaxID=178035 RepID=A0A154P3V3_DUFNO|nr:hypothetical protein WN55_10413 [Dufourea novaeangliae]